MNQARSGTSPGIEGPVRKAWRTDSCEEQNRDAKSVRQLAHPLCSEPAQRRHPKRRILPMESAPEHRVGCPSSQRRASVSRL
jgi:hypothetical protein